MTTLPPSIARMLGEDAGLAQRLEAVYTETASLNPDSQDFEIAVREGLVTCDDRLTADEAARLHAAIVREGETASGSEGREMLPAFYADFDWLNRCEPDEAVRLRRWRELFGAAGSSLDGFSLYHYARSRYLLATKQQDASLAEARSATKLAPGNAGWLNNYSEMLLDSVEAGILAGEPAADAQEVRDDLADLLFRFEALIADDGMVYPAFLQSCGRIEACLENRESAEDYFEQAKARVMELHRSGHPRFAAEGAYVEELGKVIRSQTLSETLQNTRQATRSIRAIEAQQKEAMAELDEKVREVSDRLEGERVNMLEFLGFFSGIISFIIAGITIGSEMGFAARGALIVVLLGALLLAFGALGLVLEGLRPVGEGKRRSSGILAWIGVGVIVLGFVLYLVAAPVLGA